MKKFGELKLNKEQIVSNSAAVVAYSNAIKDMPDAPAASVTKAAKDAIIGFLGGKTDPFAPMKAFGELKLNAAGITANAKAVSEFGTAMSTVPEIKAERSGGLIGSIASFFAGEKKMPWDAVKLFSEADLGNVENVRKNAEALAAFGTAMSTVPEIKAERTGGLMGGVASFFAGDVKMPWDQVKLFSEADLGNVENVKKNAEAISAFGTAMSTMPEIKAERSGGLLGAIGNFFGGKKKMPWDQVKAFADADMGDPAQLKLNAESLTAFGISLKGLADIPTDIEDRLKGLGNGLEEFADYINDGEIETITQFATAMAKFPIGTFTGRLSGTDTMSDMEKNQAGGFLSAGDWSLVGEKGPELVKFGQDAGIVSNNQMKAGRDFAMNAAKLDAISQPPAGPGGGGSSTVMITNAPSTSNIANTKVETAAGVSDPHTQLAGVY
jgi:hypothetical protein